MNVFSSPAAAETPSNAPQHDPRMDAPLLEAAEAGDAAKVAALLEQGADPETLNRFGWPVSVLAACRGHTEVLRRLYERDHYTAHQNAPGSWTPLIEAASHGHLDTVRFLLACHAATDLGTDEGMNAESYARNHEHPDIVAALREASGEPAVANPAVGPTDSPLVAAATAGDADGLAKLLDRGASVETRNVSGKTLLFCATSGNKPEVVRLLLARHADPNNLSLRGNSPLDCAAKYGHEEIVKMLLEAGADPNGFRASDGMGDTYSPLFLSFEKGRLAVTRLLLAHGRG